MGRKRIEPAEWPEFCDSFSRLHRGWTATIGVMDTAVLELAEEVEPHAVAVDLPFQGISMEPSGSGLVILLGEHHHRYTHDVPGPGAIYLETFVQGAHKGLRIDAVDGRTTLLHFRSPVLPEELNGLAERETK